MTYKFRLRPMLIIMLAVFLVGNSLIATAAQTDGTVIKQGYSYRNPDFLEGFTSVSKGNLIFMRKKAIAKLYANEESIESFYTPEDPANPNIIFFSTVTVPENGFTADKTKNKIYSYNIKTGALKRVYQERESRLLRTLGIDGSKLIVMYDGIDNSPGPCFSVWADWTDFGYLDLANIKAGLKPYTMPQYKITEGKAEQKKCEANM